MSWQGNSKQRSASSDVEYQLKVVRGLDISANGGMILLNPTPLGGGRNQEQQL